ncbi:hypothetical protein JCM11957_07400 [Caminibacter profundus]
MDVKKILNIKNPVSLVRYVDGKVGIIDKLNTFRIYDANDFKLLGGFKVSLPENNPLENSIAISPKGTYLAIPIKGKNKTTIWKIKEKKLLHTLGWHKGEVLCVNFDFDENYLLTGGMDGRAYLWSVELGKMVTSLPPHPDYVISGAFSKNSLWTATGSYDKMLNVTNISSMNISFRKKSHRGAITQIKFLKHQRMVSGDKTGELIVWDYTKGKVISRLQSVADMVIDFDFDENEEFMFVITKDKNVYLYDLKNYELISEKFIKINELPSSISYVAENSTLWIGTLGGSVYIFDIYEDNKKLSDAILKKDYAKAYEIVKQNPFLIRTEEYQNLEKTWEKTITAAYKLMEQAQYDKARQLLTPFLAVPQKRTIIQNILNDFSEFEKFKTAVIKGKYPLAYSLATKYPSFRDTAYYKKIESDWKKVFNKAKELIRIKGKEDRVRQLLAPFRGVSQKTPLIQSLFNDKQLFSLFRSFLMKRKFEEFFRLVEKYPFLYETPEYEQALKFGERLKDAAIKSLKNGKFKESMEYAEMLKKFPKYKEEAEDFIKKSNIYSSFLNALANKEYDLVEKMVSENAFLEDSDDYLMFKRMTTDKFKQAEKEALSGNIDKVSTILNDLLHSSIYKHRAEQIIKSAYLNQLLNAVKDKEKIQKGVNNYISYFGYDNEIEDIIKKAKFYKTEPIIKSLEKSRLIDFDNLPKFIWEES